MKTAIIVSLPNDWQGTCDTETIRLPAGTLLSGQLTLEPSDGPWGIREFEQPHYLTATFDLMCGGRSLRYSDLITQEDLWAPSGTKVQTDCAAFVDHVGRLDGMMDAREDWSYVLPDGTTHANRLKYTSCHFWVTAAPSSLLVRCQYYDTSVGGMVTIFYSRPWAALLLLKDTKLFRDSEGNLSDFAPHGGLTTTLKSIGEPSARPHRSPGAGLPSGQP